MIVIVLRTQKEEVPLAHEAARAVSLNCKALGTGQGEYQ